MKNRALGQFREEQIFSPYIAFPGFSRFRVTGNQPSFDSMEEAGGR